jgi:hypothetical protein
MNSVKVGGRTNRQKRNNPAEAKPMGRTIDPNKKTHARPGKEAASMPTSRPWCVNA